MDKIIKRHNPQNEKEVLDKYKEVVGKCPECGNDLIVRYSKFGSFVACINYPQCKYFQKEKKEQIVIKICPQCDGDLVLRCTKKGTYYLYCSNYPQCKYGEWIDETDEKLMRIINDVESNKKNIAIKGNKGIDNTNKHFDEEKLERYSSQFRKGKRDDIDDEVRSSWEANVTRLFNYLKVDYSYETNSYKLITLNDRYKFASPSYLPDYILKDGTIIEVKGHLSARSLANMKAFQELYPNEIIKVIDNDIYYLIDKKYSEIVPNWEKTQNSPMQDIDVVGIRIKERIPFVAKLNEGDELILERDFNNKYDKNAIKVLDSDKHHIGYIDSFYACYLAPKLDLGIEYTMKLKHKNDNVLKCSIKSINLDLINIKNFLEFL